MPMRVKKTERFQLRLTPAEKEKLTEKAAEARMSVSDYVAELIDNSSFQVLEKIPTCRWVIDYQKKAYLHSFPYLKRAFWNIVNVIFMFFICLLCIIADVL